MVANVASIAGIPAMWVLSIYSAVKAAVINSIKALVLGLAPRIRVDAVASGVLRTKMGESVIHVLGMDEEEFVKKYVLPAGL